jgi:uncharacterized membrane protein
MSGRRAIFFAASPILLLYAFQNWDLLALSAGVGGIYLWWTGRPRAAAVAFALGGALKLFPALFIFPLVADGIVRQSRREAWKTAAFGVGFLVLLNLPFALLNASGWWATYRFHADRPPTSSGTAWAVLDKHLGTHTENVLSFAALASALAIITLCLSRPAAVSYPVVEWCAATTAVFVVFNKVSSPQYLLWIVPFLALLPLRSVWWWLLSAIGLLRYAALFGVHDFPLGLHTADDFVHIAVLLQSAALLAYGGAILYRSRLRPAYHVAVAARRGAANA